MSEPNAESKRVLLGYRHLSGIPLCPCRDPGNFAAVEQPGADPLAFLIRCWCGSTMRGTFDSMEERAEFLQRHGAQIDGSGA